MRYDALIKRLRHQPYAYDHDGMELEDQSVCNEAADTIEELQRLVGNFGSIAKRESLTIRDRMDTLMMLHLIGVPPDKVPEIESMLNYWMAQAAEKQEQIDSLWEQLEQRDKDYVTLHDAVNKVITETNEMGTLFDAFQSATQDRFRLQQELNAMRQNYNSALAIINENNRHLDELNKLKAEVEIMRADVRRYRRLRDRGADLAVHVAVLTKDGGYCPKGHDCDAAIDSVMYLESLPCGRSLS